MRPTLLAIAAVTMLAAAPPPVRASDAPVAGDGIIKVKSAFTFVETVARLEADIAAKRIRLFLNLDQAQLATEAGIVLHPSTLLMFGNPPLGTQLITSKAEAGLDWPVRMLVSETASGDVTVSYTDFDWIRQRHGITDRDAQIAKATEVAASIAGSITQKRAAEAR